MNSVTLDTSHVYFCGYRLRQALSYSFITPIIEKRERYTGTLLQRKEESELQFHTSVYKEDFFTNITSDENYIYTSMSFFSGTYGMRCQCKSKSNLETVWTSDILFDASDGADFWGVTGVVCDNTHIYALLNGNKSGTKNFRIYKILKSNGSVVSYKDLTFTEGFINDISIDDDYVYVATNFGIGKYSKSDFSESFTFLSFGQFSDQLGSGNQNLYCIDVDSEAIYCGAIVWRGTIEVGTSKVIKVSLDGSDIIFEKEVFQNTTSKNSSVVLSCLKVFSDYIFVCGWSSYYSCSGDFVRFPRIEILSKEDGSRIKNYRADIPPVDVMLNGIQVDGENVFCGGNKTTTSESIFAMVNIITNDYPPSPFIEYVEDVGSPPFPISVFPTFGSPGTLITISGKNFSNQDSAYLSNVSLTNLTFIDEETLQGRCPTLPEGKHDLIVERNGSKGLLCSAFQVYLAT